MVHRLRICRSRRMRVVGVNGWMGSDWNRTHLMSAIVANAAGERERERRMRRALEARTR